MSSITVDSGEPDQVFSCRANAKYTHAFSGKPEFLLNGVLGFPGILTDQMSGVPQFRRAIMDIKVLPVSSGPLNQYAIKARKFEIRTHITVGLSRGNPVVHGTLGHDRNAS